MIRIPLTGLVTAAVAGGYGSQFIVAAAAIGLAGSLLLGGGFALAMLSSGMFAACASIGVLQARSSLNQHANEQATASIKAEASQEPSLANVPQRSFADTELARREQPQLSEQSR
jgi:hypothetical protein